MKPHTAFSKIFNGAAPAVCNTEQGLNLQLPLTCRACCGAAYKTSQSVSDVRFMFDGQRVTPNQTPQELGMEDEDSIDAFIEQVNSSSGAGQVVCVTQAAQPFPQGLKRLGPILYLELLAQLTAVWVQTGGR